MAALFAATFPERTNALVLYATFARATWAPGYEWAWPAELRDAHMDELLAHWGEGWVAGSVAPSQQSDPNFMEWAGRLERLAASPSTIRRIFELIGELRRARRAAVDPRAHARDAPDARTASSRSSTPATSPRRSRARATWSSRAATTCSRSATRTALLGEIEEFLTGTRHEREPDRMLATVMFTDIVDSTRRAAEMGDRGWRFLLERHDALFRQALERHRGREVKRTGDGFLATFDGPARAIRCAASVAEAMGTLGLEVRAGLHTGELEVMDGDFGGLAVHIASRVMSCAAPNEVLVSGTVKDLVVGSGIDFEDRGETRAARRAGRVAPVRRELAGSATATLKPSRGYGTSRYVHVGSRPVRPHAFMRRTALLTALLASLAVPATADAAVRHVIRGAGFGHGIGMSQYGAYGYALEGAKYPGILAHYYKGTRLSSAPSGRCACCSSRWTRTSACAAPPRSAGRALKPSRIYVAKRGAGGIVVTTASGKRVARFGSIVKFRSEDPMRLMGPALNSVTSGLYRGNIEVRVDGGGVTAINELDMDSYLRGVVAGEMPSTWPLEALKVQAVAARTYALATRKTDGAFDQYPDTRSQVYRGVTGESVRSDAAVSDTAGPHRDLRRRAGRDLLLLHLRRPHRERRVLVRRLALEAVARGSAGPV